MNRDIKGIARLAGVLYLSIFILAPLSLLYLPATLVVPGDASATAANVAASESLFRIGIVGDSVLVLIEVVLSAIFYVLLRPVSRTLALVSALSRLGEAFIMSLNILVHLFVLQLVDAPFLTAFEPEQLNGLVLLALDLHGDGILVSQIFFGFHLATLGILLYRSDRFPRILGVLLTIASVGYLLESFGTFLLPGYAQVFAAIVIALAAIPELSLTVWLLVRGVRSPRGGDAPAARLGRPAPEA